MTKGTMRMSNEFLSKLIFGNDEVNIVGIDEVCSEQYVNGYTVFEIEGNPDCLGRTNGVAIKVIYQTEVKIVNRKIEII